ncbi:hypothetical protein M0802_009154 [Mischocyttarus mexicanus]|nr:hypothetical protein M0802_009154 [Mischocyttarus mexicanus]
MQKKVTSTDCWRKMRRERNVKAPHREMQEIRQDGMKGLQTTEYCKKKNLKLMKAKCGSIQLDNLVNSSSRYRVIEVKVSI